MDPDACLAELRRLTKEWDERGHTMDADEAYNTLSAIAQSFEALDKWISDGGFLPAPWRL